MSKSKEVLELKKKLAEAEAKESNFAEYSLWVKEGDGINEIQVHEKSLSEIEKAEMIDAVIDLALHLEYILNDKETTDSTRMGYWAKVTFLLDKPTQKLLSTAFGLTEKMGPAVFNAAVIEGLIANNEWLRVEATGVVENLAILSKLEKQK